MKKTVLRLALCVSIAVAAFQVEAGLFNWGSDDKDASANAASPTNATRRYHMRIPDQATEKELLTLFAQKRATSETFLVMRNLTQEKSSELARFEKDLQDKYGMKTDSNYSFDQDKMTLYEVTFKAPAAPDPTPAGEAATATQQAEKKVYRQFKDADEAKQLALLMTGKKLTLEELRVFNLVIREKQMEMDRLNTVLSDKFSMSRDRDYQYEPATMRLYEIVPLPKKSIAPPPQQKPTVPAAAPAKTGAPAAASKTNYR